MGCGTIKTSESDSKYVDSNINQNELLPEIKVNKKPDSEEEKKNQEQKQNDSLSKSNSINENSKKNDPKIENKSKAINKSIEISKNISLNKKINSENNRGNSKRLNLDKSSENKNENSSNSSENDSENTNKNEEPRKSEKISEIENNNQEKIIESEQKEFTFKKKENKSDKINSSCSSSNKYKLPTVVKKEISKGILNKKFLEIEVKANRYDTIFPIWIPKEEEIKFIVEGKWKLNKETECDCQGIQSDNNEYKFNDGALLGRVPKGELFQIYNGLKYISNISGPLVLKMNLNSVWEREKPEGSLKIKMYGARKIENVDDLEEKMGWWKQLRIIDYNNKDILPDYKLSKTEEAIIILFNKLRHDSKLFSSQYIDNYQRLTPTTKRIYEYFMSNKDQFIPFKINLSIIKLLNNFYSKFIDEKSKKNSKKDDWNYIFKSDVYLQKYLEQSFNSKKKLHVSIIRYYEDNPLFLALRILFRDNIRNNMLSYNFEEISMINLSDDLNSDKTIYYCIIVLSNQNGNDKVNYELNNNIEQFIEDEKKLEAKISIVKN